ncbi:GNAT family N-acetyltransferase [Halobacillus salinarum]|uniref:GNAT family N-acetyltransferase n=1 Tax=Halobacillus salinarum TaxID=2932257 RepID=A0ABY4EJU9_9BACI|nr:GNAT family N-acetyltransferase [Halobacillus salinarum]UOQ44751.1 GNAT family N-acetyltransferase [Halobacillus salinarum]
MKLLTFDQAYANIDHQRERLYPLFQEVFNIPQEAFKKLYHNGFWDHTYRPFTYFIDNQAISNTAFFDMPLIMKGKIYQSAGIQSVMTHPDYRGEGLMKTLFKLMLETIDEKYERSFLYTDEPDRYTSFGFREVPEYYFTASYSHPPTDSDELRLLDLFEDNDLQLIRRLLKENEPASHEMTALTYKTSFYLNMYQTELSSHLYYAKSLDLLLLFEVVHGRLELYDCIGSYMPDLQEICSLISQPFKEVHVFFNPDRLRGSFTPVTYNRGTTLMVRGTFPLENESFMLPITAEF